SELAALDECVPPLLLLEPLLPTATDELPLPGETDTDEPPPPGVTVVVPLSPPGPVVTVVEFEPEPQSLQVTTRHGLPLTMTVPSELELTETLSARAGPALASRPIRMG